MQPLHEQRIKNTSSWSVISLSFNGGSPRILEVETKKALKRDPFLLSKKWIVFPIIIMFQGASLLLWVCLAGGGFTSEKPSVFPRIRTCSPLHDSQVPQFFWCYTQKKWSNMASKAKHYMLHLKKCFQFPVSKVFEDLSPKNVSKFQVNLLVNLSFQNLSVLRSNPPLWCTCHCHPTSRGERSTRPKGDSVRHVIFWKEIWVALELYSYVIVVELYA